MRSAALLGTQAAAPSSAGVVHSLAEALRPWPLSVATSTPRGVASATVDPSGERAAPSSTGTPGASARASASAGRGCPSRGTATTSPRMARRAPCAEVPRKSTGTREEAVQRGGVRMGSGTSTWSAPISKRAIRVGASQRSSTEASVQVGASPGGQARRVGHLSAASTGDSSNEMRSTRITFSRVRTRRSPPLLKATGPKAGAGLTSGVTAVVRTSLPPREGIDLATSASRSLRRPSTRPRAATAASGSPRLRAASTSAMAASSRRRTSPQWTGPAEVVIAGWPASSQSRL